MVPRRAAARSFCPKFFSRDSIAPASQQEMPSAVRTIGSRALAAILAATIAGYSRLMGEDKEDTPRRRGMLAAPDAVRGELTDPKIDEH
jgi:hypothetical protein